MTSSSMTTTDLDARLEAIEKALLGGSDIPGSLASIDLSLTSLNAMMVMLKRDTEKKLEFSRRLESYFGPVIEGKNPPLDGEQVATKAYVDQALTRFAGVIRSEIASAVQACAPEPPHLWPAPPPEAKPKKSSTGKRSR